MQRPSVFETMHPAVPALCLGGAALVGMFAFQPVYVALSLLGSSLFALVSLGPTDFARKLVWALPMLALACLANPLFSASGSTELLRMGPMVVYAESLAYGACMGALLVSTLLWFEAMALAITPDRVLSTAGRLLPTVSLVVSVAMGLVPQLMRRAQGMRHALHACTCAGTRSATNEAARLSTMLVSWSLEDSLERADAMRARGWSASAKRSSYRSYYVRPADKIALAVLALLVAASAMLGWVACSQWRFYPTMPRLVAWWGYVPYMLLVALPTLAVLMGELRWAQASGRPSVREEVASHGAGGA